MNPEIPRNGWLRTAVWLLVAITVILAGWALHATGTFMVPVVFSIFLTLLVAPLDRWIAERVPEKARWLGHVAAMGAILVALLVFVGLIWVAAQQVVSRFPLPEGGGSFLPQIGAEGSGAGGSGSGSGSGGASGSRSGSPSGGAPAEGAPATGSAAESGSAAGQATGQSASSAGGILGRVRDLFSGAGGSLLGSLGDWASGIATRILSAAGATLGAVVLILFLTLIMLIEAPAWRQKMVNLLDDSARREALESIGVIAQRLRRYLLARTILGAITAALYAGWLWIFGVDLLIVWALLAFLLNFIPTLGSLIAGALPVAYAFVQKDFGTAMAIGAGLLVIEQVMGNYIDPRVQGRQVSLSSLVVLITLLVWSWIWGVAGAILAVPITIAAMIICAHIPRLRPFALTLSNATDMEGLDRQAVGR